MKRRIQHLILSATFMALTCGIARGYAEPSIEITPSTRHIRAANPLFVKVVIHNTGANDVALDQLIGTEYGTAQFQIGNKRTNRFEDVTVPGEGRRSPISSPSIPPGGRYIFYEVLFVDDESEGFVFSRTQALDLRVIVSTRIYAEQRKAASEPIAVEVQPIAGEELELIRRNRDLLRSVIRTEFPYGFANPGGEMARQLDQLEQVRQQLSASALRKTLGWILGIARAGLLEGDAADEALREVLDQTRQEAGPVMEEIVTLMVADAYAKLQRWEIAADVLSNLPEGVYRAHRLKHSYEWEALLEEKRRQGKLEEVPQ